MQTFGQFIREMAEFPVKETPHQKQIRLSRGYKKIVRIDAAKFKARFEAEQGQKLDWNASRADRLKDLESVDAYPQGVHGLGRAGGCVGRTTSNRKRRRERYVDQSFYAESKKGRGHSVRLGCLT
jgi:hypothetical protein